MFIPLLKPILRIVGLVLSFVLYALLILAAYGGRINPDISSLPSTLTLILPYLGIATAIVTIAWFACGRLFAGALGVLAIIATWGPLSTCIPFGSSKEATPGAQTFTIMTYNIKHGEPQDNIDSTVNRTFEYIINSGADIVNLQELITLDEKEVPKLTEAQLKRLREVYPYYTGDPSNDMKVMSKYPVLFENGYNYIDGDFDQKRYSFFKVNINGRKLTLINVHLKSFSLSAEECEDVSDLGSGGAILKGSVREKLDKGFKKRKVDAGILRRTINRMKGAMVICGDFNDVPESYAYRLLRGEDLKDAYVETGFGPMVTFNAHYFWFHLDHIFYRGPLRALSVRKGKTKMSDHYPLIAEFEYTDLENSAK